MKPILTTTKPSSWGIFGGLLCFGLLLGILWIRLPDTWPETLRIEVRTQPQAKGCQEPLITTGERGAGDFLLLRHDGEGKARIGFDSWGQKCLYSEPFEIRPNQPFILELRHPSLLQNLPMGSLESRLTLRIEGKTLFDGNVHSFPSLAGVYFGENPLGGSSCTARLTGELYLDGWRMLGKASAPNSSRTGRLLAWLTQEPGRVVAALLISLLAGLAAAQLPRLRTRGDGQDRTVERRLRLWFLGAAAPCLAIFIHLVSYGEFRIVETENFGSFFDYQARSLLAGRLDVPQHAIGGEAFKYQGKYYGYFGVTPSLVRMPFVLTNVGIMKLSRSLMIVYFAVSLWAAARLLRQCFRLAAGPQARPPGWVLAAFVVATGLGSTLLFLGSRSYLYHEAILCGIALALLSCSCTLGWLEKPESRLWLGALLLGALSVNARPPAGLFALALCATAALAVALTVWSRMGSEPPLRRLWKAALDRPRPLLVMIGAALGVLSFNGVSYLKFETVEGCPLRYNVQYMERPSRLERIEYKQFHLSNIPFNLHAYLTGKHFELNRHFPFLHMSGVSAPEGWTANRIDMSENTVAIPVAMPALFLLASAGGLFGLVFVPSLRRPVAIIWVAGMPGCLAMLAAIACSHRYTGDFLPLLILAAAAGLCAFCLGLKKLRRSLSVLLLALVLLSVLINAALAYAYQRTGVWGVEKRHEQSYKEFCKQVDEFFLGPPKSP